MFLKNSIGFLDKIVVIKVIIKIRKPQSQWTLRFWIIRV